MTTENENQRMANEHAEIAARMGHVKHKILVLSGKGGVGKSTVAANLALSLASRGAKVGLLDVDLHGPSIPQLLGVSASPEHVITSDDETALLRPVSAGPNLCVMSTAFLLEDRDAAVIWRGPMKHKVIKQFLKDVAWGDLDYLIVDSPPGTGDEPLAVVQLLENATGAVIVTTPQELAISDVRKCVDFCRKLALPVLGVVENMSGFVCPSCGERVDVFKSGGGESMAASLKVPFLSRIPIDPLLVKAGDDGTSYLECFPETETAQAFETAIAKIVSKTEPTEDVGEQNKRRDEMMIAIPLTDGKLSAHFGHCETFAMIETDTENKSITSTEMVEPPPHEPGLLPRWLAEKGATMIIAGGMGSRAQNLFKQQKISVVVGAPADSPEAIVSAYLKGALVSGENVCDH